MTASPHKAGLPPSGRLHQRFLPTHPRRKSHFPASNHRKQTRKLDQIKPTGLAASPQRFADVVRATSWVFCHQSRACSATTQKIKHNESNLTHQICASADTGRQGKSHEKIIRGISSKDWMALALQSTINETSRLALVFARVSGLYSKISKKRWNVVLE